MLFYYLVDLEKQIKNWTPALFRNDENPIEYLCQLKIELQELPDIPYHYLTERKNNIQHAIESLIEQHEPI